MNEQVILVLPLGDQAVRFQTTVRDDLIAIGAFQHDVGFLERLVGIAIYVLARRPAADAGRALRLRNRFQVLLTDEMRQFLVLNFDGARRVLGLVFGFRDDSEYLVTRPLNLRAGVLSDLDGFHARHLFGDTRVNADDLGMRVRRAHDLAKEHTGAVDVVSVFRPARDLVRAVDARDALADVRAFAFFGPFVLSHCSCLLSSISPALSSSAVKPARWRP